MVTNNSTTEVSQTFVSLNKSRQRSYYYKRITVKGGDMLWMRTEKLPSDLLSREYYKTKGFRLDPPQGTEWAKDLPPTPEDIERQKLYEEVAQLKKQLDEKSQLEKELENVKLQVKAITEGAHSGQKGRPRGRPRKT